MADEHWHNKAENSGQTVQARDVHGGITFFINKNAVKLVSLGGVLVLAGGAALWLTQRPHDPAAPQAAPSSTVSSAPPAAIRLAGKVMMDESAFDKVVPSGDLEHEDVVVNFSERTPATRPSQAEWFAAHGAVGVNQARWSFSLDGMLDHTVQLADVRPVELECGEPLGGTCFSDPGAAEDPEHLVIDLDQPKPRFLLSSPERDQPPQPLFERKVDLKKNESTPFLLIANATKQHCKFSCSSSTPPTGSSGSTSWTSTASPSR
ncbi:hypothetical protein [Lentzea guizhouensis]|uniref:hypothetical protein n=1 Tax=Lentzea guizhouensis TaxID=1586287 RepID=UPI0012B6A1A8|nr:hypothetical protein [Lentzea guizhouensis]